MARGTFKTVRPGVRAYINENGKTVSYAAWVNDASGKMLWLPSVKTLKEAQAARNDYLSARGKGTAPSATSVTVAQLWSEFELHLSGLVVAGERRPATLRLFKQHWKNHVEKQLGRTKLRDLSRGHVVDLTSACRKKGLKPASLVSVRAALSAALEYGIEKNYVSVNVVKMVKPPEVRRKDSRSRALTEDEAASLVAHAKDRWRLPFMLALACGARSAELRGLQWRHFQGDALTIEGQLLPDGTIGPPKSDAGTRLIVLPNHVALALKKHRLASDFSGDGDYIFCDATGRPCPGSSFLEAVQATAKRAGISGTVTVHTLRHSYCSLLIHRGVDVVTVANQAGHSRPSVTTDLYGHVDLSEAKVEQLRAALAV